MGAVYRGSQHSVGRDCAIKVISPDLVSDPDVIKRFLREAKLASRLSHPNAVAVLDFGQTEDGVFYLAMELVTGRTLDQVFKAEKTFKPERVVRIGSQVCDALEGAHALQIVHRDLKPSNIMLLNRGRDLVKVLDFGLAKSLAPDQTSTTMTNAGALLGTPAFMPPELALGQPCDGRADLYSLGCVLYLLGSGRLPFQSTSAHELIAMHGTEKAPAMTGVPPALATGDRSDAREGSERPVPERERGARGARGRGRRPPLHAARRRAGRRRHEPEPRPVPEDDRRSDERRRRSRRLRPSRARPSRPKMSTEMEQLVTGATMAAVNDTIIHQPATPAAQPRASRPRWLVPVIAAGVLAAGAGAFFIADGGSKSPRRPPNRSRPSPPPRSRPSADAGREARRAGREGLRSGREAARPGRRRPRSQAARAAARGQARQEAADPVDTEDHVARRPRTTKPPEPPKTGSNKPALPF